MRRVPHFPLLVFVFLLMNPASESQSAVTETPWTFRVNPGLEPGAIPSVEAARGGAPAPLRWRITELAPEAGRLLADIESTTAAIHHIIPPSVGRNTHVKFEIWTGAPRENAAVEPEPDFVWTTLLCPSRVNLMDYKGLATLPPPADFDAFWERAKAELDAIAPEAAITRAPDRDTTHGLLFRVEIPAVRETRIVCWQYIPKSAFDKNGSIARRCPAIIIMPGYGAEEPPVDRTEAGFLTLSVNPRNHGPSREFWKSPVEHMVYNIEDPENYYYKLAFLDCLQAARWLFTRPEADPARVASEGGSQGGLFAIALAMLEPRIACVCSNVTAFSAYPDGMLLSRLGHMTAFRKRLEEAAPEEAERIRRSLAYTDGANLATRLKQPTQIQMGGVDPVCNYVAGIVLYNRLPEGVEKEFHVLPAARHEVPPLMRQNNLRWYKRWLRLE